MNNTFTSFLRNLANSKNTQGTQPASSTQTAVPAAKPDSLSPYDPASRKFKYGKAIQKLQYENLLEQTRTAAEDRAASKKLEEERRTQATQQFAPYKQSIQDQLSKGLISYQDAQAALADYASKYDIGPQGGAQQELTDYYLKNVQPGQQQSQIESAYQEYFGTGPTEEQRKQAQERFQSGYYKSVGDLKDSLKMSDAYQDKFNQSYLENYYQTMYGKAQKDQAGTKRYQFKFDPSLLPKYTGDLAKQTGVEIPETQSNFFGTAGEIEANLDAIKDTKNFIYRSGLTNLQGQIDKEVQSLKNEGTREIAKIQQGTGLYGLISNAFT